MTANYGEESLKKSSTDSYSVRTGNSNFSDNRSVRPQQNGLEVKKISSNNSKLDESVLVVAFDGMDYELTQEFGCENLLTLKEVGNIDNQTSVSSIKTSELFASFITGANYEEHGIKGLSRNHLRSKVLDLIPSYLLNNVRGFHRLNESLEILLGVDNPGFYDRTDLETTSIFDEVDNSKALFVPGYNPSLFWKKNALGYSFSDVDTENRDWEYYWDDIEFRRRKDKLFRPVNKWYDFLMVHFHRIDTYQHLYEDPWSCEEDYEKLRNVYLEMDSLAEKILEFFGDDYSTILFMSDHGLPTEKEHNENAFYSCNEELFPETVPRITDFYYKILGETEKHVYRKAAKQGEAHHV